MNSREKNISSLWMAFGLLAFCLPLLASKFPAHVQSFLKPGWVLGTLLQAQMVCLILLWIPFIAWKDDYPMTKAAKLSLILWLAPLPLYVPALYFSGTTREQFLWQWFYLLDILWATFLLIRLCAVFGEGGKRGGLALILFLCIGSPLLVFVNLEYMATPWPGLRWLSPFFVIRELFYVQNQGALAFWALTAPALFSLAALFILKCLPFALRRLFSLDIKETWAVEK